MTDETWDPDDNVGAALRRIVQVHGKQVLSKQSDGGRSSFMGAASDQLTGVPAKTTELLRQAVDSGVATDIERQIRTGLSPDEAVNSVATRLVESTPTDATGCMWVTREIARALGYQIGGDEDFANVDRNVQVPTDRQGIDETLHKGRQDFRGNERDEATWRRDGRDGDPQQRSRPSPVVVVAAVIIVVVAAALLFEHGNHKWPFSPEAATSPTTTTSSPVASTTTTSSTPPVSNPVSEVSQQATSLSDLLVQSSAIAMRSCRQSPPLRTARIWRRTSRRSTILPPAVRGS